MIVVPLRSSGCCDGERVGDTAVPDGERVVVVASADGWVEEGPSRVVVGVSGAGGPGIEDVPHPTRSRQMRRATARTFPVCSDRRVFCSFEHRW
jgi:hypothetical protein